LPVDVRALGCDLLTLSAHKFGGPKGAGVLYVRQGVELARLIHGGGQERSRRAGTENVEGVVGLARAAELAVRDRAQVASRLEVLRDRLIAWVLESVPGVRLTGHPSQRMQGLASFVCEGGVDGAPPLMRLALEGVAASSGSACTSGSLE